MTFNSHAFVLLFLPTTVLGFWLLRRRFGEDSAHTWLIGTSILFYALEGLQGMLAIIPMMASTYGLALLMLSDAPGVRRFNGYLLSVGVVVNSCFLCYFKYQGFFVPEMADVYMQLLWPLGLSFLVFQNIAFLADVKAGNIRSIAVRDYALFLLFFPKIIAGPIVHYNDVIPQLKSGRQFRMEHLAVGLFLFSVGLFKKTVIADPLVPYVDEVFQPKPWDVGVPQTVITAWVGVLAYTLQLYFDFSGYSDMALGVSRMFGVKLPVNFDSPLKASSIIDFWARWHMTLTRFLTDYIYTPLMLWVARFRVSRGLAVLRARQATLGAIAQQVAVPSMVTMLVSGIWHGVGWQFVVWGALHGLYLTVNQTWRLFRPRFWRDTLSYERFMRPLGMFLTISALIIAFVFFRAPTVGSAIDILGGLVGQNGLLPYDLQLIQQLDIAVPWSVFAVYVHVGPLLWIAALSAAVLTLPNSLELLRRYEPALNFSPAEEQPMASLQKSLQRPSRLTLLGQHGFTIGREFGAVLALFFALGFAGIVGESGFIYEKF